MKENLLIKKEYYQDIAAIVTAMTNDERYFLFETLQSVLLDPDISQVVLCIDEKNNWLESVCAPIISDSRLTIIRLPLMPIGGVRNKALTHVQKNWVTYCDGDDVWCKNKTHIQRSYASQTKADFVGGGHYLMTEAGKISAYGLSLFIPMPSSWMVKTEIMRRYPFNEFSLRGSDGEWWVSTSDKIQKVKCPEVLIYYRVRSYSVSSMALSKKRKLNFVNLASIPLLGSVLLFLTYCIWMVTKNKPYKWMPYWPTWLRKYEKAH